jgi:hypothetical protein
VAYLDDQLADLFLLLPDFPKHVLPIEKKHQLVVYRDRKLCLAPLFQVLEGHFCEEDHADLEHFRNPIY